MPDQEIVRRVECMQNMAIRLVEEVPEPTQTRVLLDGDTEGDEAPLKELIRASLAKSRDCLPSIDVALQPKTVSVIACPQAGSAPKN